MIGLCFIIDFSIVVSRGVFSGDGGYVFEVFPGDNVIVVVVMAVVEDCWFCGCHFNWV